MTYRYGFNGKENDNEVKGGDGLQQDYGMRIYDSRLGRFLSVDPLTQSFPYLTPYQFAGNSPLENIDMDGLEPHRATIQGLSRYSDNSIKVTGFIDIKIQVLNQSSIASKDLKLFDLKEGIRQGLTNMMEGSTTSRQTTAFTTKNGKVIMLPGNKIEEHNITYEMKINITVTVINDFNELSPDAIPIALVDKTGEAEAGLANTNTYVAKMDASYAKSEATLQTGINIALHEIAHVLGAVDIYKKDDLDKVKTPNLMNSVKYMNRELTPEQINQMWRSTLGAWQILWMKSAENNGPATSVETNDDVKKDMKEHLK